MTSRNKITVAAALIGLSLIGLGLLLLGRQSSGGPPPCFVAIADEMTPQEVQALLGTERAEGVSADGQPTEHYFLHDADSRGSITVVYRKGRVIAKV